MEVLLLCDYRPKGAATVLDHINALRFDTGHKVRMLSILGNLPENLDVNRFDAVIVHYSLILSNDAYVSGSVRDKLRAYDGVKAVFIQDEYRWVNRAIDALNYIRADLLFTCVPEGEIDKVYPMDKTPGVRKVNTLTGYVPKKLLSVEPIHYDHRSRDVGYRARKLSALFGALAQEKWLIAKRFSEDARKFGLNCDISCSESDRLYGRDWIEFVRSCRAVLGSESGASVFDFDGQLQCDIENLERQRPDIPFEEVKKKFFDDQDGTIRMNQISPRCFEAAALRTLMVLYEGDYSNVLRPWEHYVPLKKDHSNMSEVVAVLRDRERWTRIVNNAYSEVACNPAWSYETFAIGVGRVLSDAWVTKGRSPATGYTDASFMRVSAAHNVAISARRNARSTLISMVESLPKPLFLGLRFVRRLLRSWN